MRLWNPSRARDVDCQSAWQALDRVPVVTFDLRGSVRTLIRSLLGRTEAGAEEVPPEEVPPAGRPALFLHTPKTAGTSIVEIAAPYYAEGMISHGDYHGHPPTDFEQVPFVSGHFGYSYAQPLMRGRVSFTFLREPRERILSYYYFCLTRDPEEWPVYALSQQLPLVDFLRRAFDDPSVRSAIWNGQVWQLAHGWANLDQRHIMLWEPDELLDLAIRHLDEFDHVGLTETFASDQDIILDLLEIPRPEAPVAANRTDGRPMLASLEPEALELLAELTELDQALYDEVLARRGVSAVPTESEGGDK